MPDTERLRGQGWQIISCNGPYCRVWKDNEEVLMVWKDGGWYQVFVVSGGCRQAG